MPPREASDLVCEAAAMIVFPRVAEFLDDILASIATHDVAVVREGEGHRVDAPSGRGSIVVEPARLLLTARASSPGSLNRLKHTLTGPISFIAASEGLDIRWTGSETGPTPLDDLRVLHVRETRLLTPRMRRIVFSGQDLARFDRPDQLHARLLFQPPGTTEPRWPMLGEQGQVVWPEEQRLATRVYTIRSIDAAKGEIAIDFALHDAAGPATRWATSASPGDVAGIVGPAANGPKPAGFHVLVGDETGLPGVARILEWLGEDAEGVAFIEVDAPAEEQPLRHPKRVSVRWLHRGGTPAGTTSLLYDAVRGLDWLEVRDRAFVWCGCEHRAFRDIHRFLRHDVALPREQQVLYSHWHRSLSEEQIVAVGGKAYLPD